MVPVLRPGPDWRPRRSPDPSLNNPKCSIRACLHGRWVPDSLNVSDCLPIVCRWTAYGHHRKSWFGDHSSVLNKTNVETEAWLRDDGVWCQTKMFPLSAGEYSQYRRLSPNREVSLNREILFIICVLFGKLSPESWPELLFNVGSWHGSCFNAGSFTLNSVLLLWFNVCTSVPSIVKAHADRIKKVLSSAIIPGWIITGSFIYFEFYPRSLFKVELWPVYNYIPPVEYGG